MAPKLKQSVHFFKMVLAHSLLEGKLRIPTEFVKKYGEGLSKSVILKLPNGEEWKLNLAKSDDGVWFEKGWKEFANYYSLAHGYLLVFRYETPSCFQVLIFNPSALEINYPFQSIEDKEANDDQGLQVQEIEILEECQPCWKRKENSLVAFHQPCMMTKTNEGDEYDNSTDLQLEASHPKSIESKGELKLQTQARKTATERNNRSSSVSFFGVCETNDKFTSEHPFFRTSIRQKDIQKRYMHFPRGFANVYIKHLGARRIVTLKVGVRTWKVILLRRKSLLLLSAGWAAFSRDNGLEAGDVCFFHLLNSDDIVMKVSILKREDTEVINDQGLQVQEIEILEECQPCRKRKENSLVAFHEPCKMTRTNEGDVYDNSTDLQLQASYSKSIESKGELKLQTQARETTTEQNNKSSSISFFGAFEANNKFTSECPFFRIIMKERDIQKRYMHFPRGFANEYIKPVKAVRRIVTLKVGVRTWRVKLICDPKRSLAYISAGWAAFLKDNGLEDGDVCFFHLLNSDDIVMKVSILKHDTYLLTT